MQAMQATDVSHFRPLAELMPVDWQRSAITTTDGATIYYTRTGGAKPSILLLHGVQADGSMWLRTAQALQTDYDVVMPDTRGHGQSSRIAGQISVDVLIEDMRALIRTLGMDQPVIVGHSMGADIAGRLAVAQAARALVLVDPALHNVSAGLNIDIDNMPPWMDALYATMRSLQTQSHAERLITGLNLLPPGMIITNEADYVSLIDGMAHFDLNFYRSALHMSYLFESDDVLARISCPTLLLTARPMMPGVNVDANIARLRQHLPALQHVHFADSGHFIPYDQLVRFVQVLTTFLHES